MTIDAASCRSTHNTNTTSYIIKIKKNSHTYTHYGLILAQHTVYIHIYMPDANKASAHTIVAQIYFPLIWSSSKRHIHAFSSFFIFSISLLVRPYCHIYYDGTSHVSSLFFLVNIQIVAQCIYMCVLVTADVYVFVFHQQYVDCRHFV